MSFSFQNLDTLFCYKYLQEHCAVFIEECDLILKKDKQGNADEDREDNINMIKDELNNYWAIFESLTQQMKTDQYALLQNSMHVNSHILTLATINMSKLMDHSRKLSGCQLTNLMKKRDALVVGHRLFLEIAKAYHNSIESADQRVVVHIQNRLITIFDEQKNSALAFITETQANLDKLGL